jgi:hypothetical protein
MVHKKQFAKEFEENLEMAELKTLSKTSLERPLTYKEYRRFTELGSKLLKK